MRSTTAAAIVCLLATLAAGDDRAKPSKLSLPERVNAAIDTGVTWLRGRQRTDGSWGDMHQDGAVAYNGNDGGYEFPAGPTALALYTLLKCGVPPDDKGVQSGFAALARLTRDGQSTYEIAATILAVAAKYDQAQRDAKSAAASGLGADPERRTALRLKPSRDDAALLAKLVSALGDRFCEGGWRYFRPTHDKSMGARQDTSSTALAMLATLAAHRCGVESPRKLVVSAVQWTLSQQDPTGPLAAEAPAKGGAAKWTPPPGARARGWAYVRKTPFESESTTTTANMTASGMVSLLAAQCVLEETAPETAASLQPSIETALTDATAWLGVHWSVNRNEGSDWYHYMYLYGLERVGGLRRVALIAGHDWYAEGATVLVGQQKSDGSWDKQDVHAPADVINTCFALLFLDRASLAVTTPK